MEDKIYPQAVCKVELKQEDITNYSSMIADEFNIQWYLVNNAVLLIRVIDDLPAASVVTVGDSEDDFWYEDTYPIGYTTEDGKYAVYNHV